MVDDLRPHWRVQFDTARDPYTARNVLGITSTGGGGGGAPTNAEYIVAASDPTLTNERVLTDTATVTWDFTTAGQAKANAATGGGGNVSNVGTPTLGQYAKWTTATTIQGVSAATVLSDIGAQPAGSYQPLDADLTAIAALTGTDTIYYRSAANTWSAVTVSTGLTFTGGVLTATATATTPGGSTTQVQYNNAGAFGGSANMTWNNATSVLTVTGQLALPLGSATSLLAGGIVESGGFKQTGGQISLGPGTAGVVALRPNGIGSATGQMLVAASGAITANGAITLPGAPTVDLHAATKKYVDDAITASAGATAPPVTPQGRLTLITVTPVMITTQTAKTTIFYTPYDGNLCPIYNGTIFTMTTFTELSNVTTASATGSAGPAAVAANSVYDLFVWSNSGTMTLTRGPAWTSDTARSAGTALVMVGGRLLNNAAITNGPAASRGTYVGTVRSNGSSQIDFQFGASGTPGFFGVWNCYNRVEFTSLARQSGSTWTYSSATVRATAGNNNTRHSFVSGLAEDGILVKHNTAASGTAGWSIIGIALDATNALDALAYTAPFSANQESWGCSNSYAPQLGFHFVAATERGDATNTHTFYGAGTNNSQQFIIAWRL